MPGDAVSTATAAPCHRFAVIRSSRLLPEPLSRGSGRKPGDAANQNGTGNFRAAEVREEDHSVRDCTHKLFRIESVAILFL